MHASAKIKTQIKLCNGAFLDTFRQRMLPRANMLATENSLRKIALMIALGMLALFSGCTPAGPRALLDGDRLLREGKPAEALKKLEIARAEIPNEPRVWNLLGLAYHHSNQPQLAAQAYQQALARDKSNIVAVAHYNLGCLLLEQNNPAAAVDHLRSYTLTTNSPIGLNKLASAQFRMRRLDLAEATYGQVLRLEPKNVEALNGVGVIHAQKNQRDAGQYFTTALQWNPNYPPALLNAGLLAQQNPSTHSLALQRFKSYVALAPTSAHADTAKAFVRQLETEFAQQAAASNALVNATLKSNALNAVVRPTNPPVETARLATAPTNNKPAVAVVKTNTPAPASKTNEPVVVSKPPVAPVTASPPVTVVTVTNAPPPKIATAAPLVTRQITAPIANPPPRNDEIPKAETIVVPEMAPSSATPPEKKPGLLTRLNPFKGKPKTAAETNEVPRSVVLVPQTNAPAATAKPVFPRYRYLSPAAPAAGKRSDAERAVAQAMKAERAGNTNEAWQNYHLALAADPSYFEAQYNTALLAYRLRDFKRALTGFETALALKPDSIDTRYNFALALKQADYANDAANELHRILEAKPDDVRAHLTLGNIYAQQFNEPAKARIHYAQVLALEPRHPQASVIRFWLAANP